MSSHGAQQAGRLTVAAFRRDLEGVRLAHVAEKGGALFALLDADEPYPVGTSSLLARIAGLPRPAALVCSGPYAHEAAIEAHERDVNVFLIRPPAYVEARSLGGTHRAAATAYAHFSPLRLQLADVWAWIAAEWRAGIRSVTMRYPGDAETGDSVRVALHHMLDALQHVANVHGSARIYGAAIRDQPVVFRGHCLLRPKGKAERELVLEVVQASRLDGDLAPVHLTVVWDGGTLEAALPSMREVTGTAGARPTGSTPARPPLTVSECLDAQLTAFIGRLLPHHAPTPKGLLPSVREAIATAGLVKAMMDATETLPARVFLE